MEDNYKQTTLFVLVSLLKQAKKIDCFSFVISVAALIIFIGMLFVVNKAILVVSLIIFLLGLVEKYYAIRVAFDKELFEYLIQHNNESLLDTLKQLDKALFSLKLIKNNDGQTSSLESRQQGVTLLLKKQLLCCVMQIVLLLLIPFIV